MTPLAFLAVKSAALRKLATREFETGLGVPLQGAPGGALSPADLRALETAPKPVGAASPVIAGGRGTRLLGGLKGKGLAGGVGLAAAALGLGGLSHLRESQAPAVQPAPIPPPDVAAAGIRPTPRTPTLRARASNWWDNMIQRYGGRR